MMIDLLQERRKRRRQDTRPFADACLSYEQRKLRELQQAHEAENRRLLQIVRHGDRPRIFLAKNEGAEYDRPLTALPHRTWSTIEGGTVAEPRRSRWCQISRFLGLQDHMRVQVTGQRHKGDVA